MPGSEFSRQIDNLNDRTGQIVKTMDVSTGTGTIFNTIYGGIIDTIVQNQYSIWNMLTRKDYSSRPDARGYRLHTARSSDGLGGGTADSAADGADYAATPGNQTYVEVGFPYRILKTDFGVTRLAEAYSRGGDSVPDIWNEEAMRAVQDHENLLDVQIFGKETAPDPVSGTDIYDLGLLVDSTNGGVVYGITRDGTPQKDYVDCTFEDANGGIARSITRELIQKGVRTMQLALEAPDLMATSFEVKDAITNIYFPMNRFSDVPTVDFKANFKVTQVEGLNILPCRNIYDRTASSSPDTRSKVAYLLNSSAMEVRHIMDRDHDGMFVAMMDAPQYFGLTHKAFLYTNVQLICRNFRKHGKINDVQA